jgi:hypothetical protein
MIDLQANGRTWARSFLILALLVSVVGNVAETVLAESDISLWLRVPRAVVWPVFTFGAIEVLVRVIWRPSASHRLARAMLLFPTVPAAISSYAHLYSLALMMGERHWVAIISPAAIDGLMIGTTLTLLFTRAIVAPAEHVLPEVAPAPEVLPEQIAPEVLPEVAPAPEILPVPVSPAAPRAPRVSWDAPKVIDMILLGSKRAEIMSATGVNSTALGRLTKVANMLREERSTPIDARTEKVSPEHIDMIRRALAPN